MLRATSPLHGEIHLPLSCALSIGRLISSDLVLDDVGVGNTHLVLHPGKTVRLQAIDKPVSMAGGMIVQPGASLVFDRSFTCRFGDVDLAVDIEPPPSARVRFSKTWVAAAALGVLSVGSAAVAMTGAPTSAPTRIMAAIQPQKLATEDRSASSIAAELTRRNLSTITIETLPEGSHRATGVLTPTELPEWQDMKRWVDQTFSGQVLLIDNVSVGVRLPVLAIQSAWVGDLPYVIDGSGEKLFVGAALAEGWMIEAIEANRVSLRRQGQRVAVRF